ncbi:MAG TPA: alpha/beta fold hydrolase [Ilumatobacteraceae bacterium]|nr:alpha/beta fold hydrolase [Ilumatobacteraceae bacterium]
MRRVPALMTLVMVMVGVSSCSATSDVVTVGVDPLGDGAGESSPGTIEPDPDTSDPDASDPDTSGTGTPDPGTPDPGNPDPGTPAPGTPDTGTLEWSPCGEAAGELIDLECATLTVPLDHAVPDGETIDLAVARTATADDDARIGSLVFNPGGPGGSGIEFLTSAAAVVPPALADRFDLVSFDPRGVGASAAIDCEVDFDDDVVLLAPGDDAGWDELVADAVGRIDTCTPESVALEPFVGTNNAARDLDALREALGDEQLNYVGFSYGTRLGATYAELFPDRVRALVLDGAVKPTDDLALIGREQGPGFDAALESFAAACDADVDCALSELGPTLDVYIGLVAEIAEVGSLPTDDGDRVLTPGELRLGVVAALYSTQLWPVLADALFVADTEQDGSLLHVLADTYLGRQPDGTYDNSQSAGIAINCADDPRRPPTDEVRVQAELSAQSSVHFAEFLRASTGCVGTVDPIDPIAIGPADGAAPILVIGTTGDPATPYEWAVEMAELLSSGVLYTVQAEGHTAFLSVPCVDDVVIDYLVDLELPDVGAACAADDSDDVFAPEGEGELDQVIALFDCLRDNGVDLPEITIGDLLADPNGDFLSDLLDPTDAAFGRAALACQDLIPGF